jgi:hypothetical protein
MTRAQKEQIALTPIWVYFDMKITEANAVNLIANGPRDLGNREETLEKAGDVPLSGVLSLYRVGSVIRA